MSESRAQEEIKSGSIQRHDINKGKRDMGRIQYTIDAHKGNRQVRLLGLVISNQYIIKKAADLIMRSVVHCCSDEVRLETVRNSSDITSV